MELSSSQLEDARTALESIGVVFCREGGERWKAAGLSQHLGGIPGVGGLWVA
jgi:hypothetical protein